jgi:hypothetical protein
MHSGMTEEYFQVKKGRAVIESRHESAYVLHRIDLT